MSILIDGLEMPQEGFVEILIRDDGTVQQTGQSYRIDGTDYYTPYVGEMPTIYKAVTVPPHYDLIDHNALKIAVMDCDAETRISFLKHAMDCINKAPVVIPSDMPTYEAEEGET